MYGDSIDNSDAGNPAIVTKPVSQQPHKYHSWPVVLPFASGSRSKRKPSFVATMQIETAQRKSKRHNVAEVLNQYRIIRQRDE